MKNGTGKNNLKKRDSPPTKKIKVMSEQERQNSPEVVESTSIEKRDDALILPKAVVDTAKNNPDK